jgi:hypothetical protein
MANTYVISSVSYMPGPFAIATITGTVNGTPVTVLCSWSTLTGFANASLAQTYIAGLMLAAFAPPQPNAPTIYNGTIVI